MLLGSGLSALNGDPHLMTPPLQIHREQTADTVTLRLAGTLDGSAAEHLRRAIVEAGGRVVLDCTHLREFKDAAVPQLCRALQGGAVTVRGLGEHHSRLFRYFGIDLGGSRDRGYYRAEELFAGV